MAVVGWLRLRWMRLAVGGPWVAFSKKLPEGFEPLRAEPNGFLVHHLNHSVTLSCERSHTAGRLTARATFRNFATRCNRAAKWRERHQRRNARAVDGLHQNDPQRNASASKLFSNCLPTQRVQQTGQAAAISTAEWCQWLRVGVITQRYVDRSHAPLRFYVSGHCRNDTCGIRTHAGRPHRLSRPTP